MQNSNWGAIDPVRAIREAMRALNVDSGKQASFVEGQTGVWLNLAVLGTWPTGGNQHQGFGDRRFDVS